jgi:hypothetical protein
MSARLEIGFGDQQERNGRPINRVDNRSVRQWIVVFWNGKVFGELAVSCGQQWISPAGMRPASALRASSSFKHAS